eukprot:12398746-Karenia_brevis.AAC.1
MSTGQVPHPHMHKAWARSGTGPNMRSTMSGPSPWSIKSPKSWGIACAGEACWLARPRRCGDGGGGTIHPP